MKKLTFVIGLFLLFIITSCSRSSCPTYDNNTGEMKIKNSKKTKSGLFP